MDGQVYDKMSTLKTSILAFSKNCRPELDLIAGMLAVNSHAGRTGEAESPVASIAAKGKG